MKEADDQIGAVNEKPLKVLDLKGGRPNLQINQMYQKDEHEIMEADENDEMHTPFKVGGTRNGLRAQVLNKDSYVAADKLSNHSSPC